MIAALFVDPKGPYPKMADVDCWDEARDAKLYAGPHAVVAHPPCGPWGRLKFLCKHQDPTCGPCAVGLVRKWGGVLEHPADSSLWKHCSLPKPVGSSEAKIVDEFGGYTIAVRQVAYGHCCAKPTWLYLVGVPVALALSGIKIGGEETHRVTNGSRGKTHLPRCTALQARATPTLFAEWLVSLARSVHQ